MANEVTIKVEVPNIASEDILGPIKVSYVCSNMENATHLTRQVNSNLYTSVTVYPAKHDAIQVVAVNAILRNFQNSLASSIVYSAEDKKAELMYLALGTSDEAGEVAGKIKKYWRGDYDLLAEDNEGVSHRLALAKELGDVLWYLTRCGHLLGFNLEEIMELNMKKLQDRHQRGVTKGDGDDR